MTARSLFKIAVPALAILSLGFMVLLGFPNSAAANSADSANAAANGANNPSSSNVSNGSANIALNKLYRIPRNNPPQPSVRNNAQVARQQRSIHDRDRLGLQHSDAIRNSVSSLPIGDDLRRPPGNGHIVPNNQVQTFRYGPSLTGYACGPYIDAYYNAFPGQRLPANVRDWTDYNYFDGNPSRYGYGRYNRMYGIGNSPQGEYFRFGFMQGYRHGQWVRESNQRVQSVLAHATTHMERGLIAFRGGQYREAAKYFKLASEMNQGDPSAMIYTAHAMFAIGRYQEGSLYLRKAFTLEPRIALLTYDMRDDYGNQPDFDNQLSALLSAADAAPGNIDRLAMLGYVYNFTAQPSRAFQVLAKARKINPNDKVVKLLYEASNPPDVE